MHLFRQDFDINLGWTSLPETIHEREMADTMTKEVNWIFAVSMLLLEMPQI